MIPKYMREVLNHSPRHRPALEDAIHATDGTMPGIAVAMGHKCRELGITDFPNPFSYDVDFGHTRARWGEHFGPQAQEMVLAAPASYVEPEVEPAEPAPAEPAPPTAGGVMPDFAGMPNKEAVEKAVLDEFDVNIDTRKMTRPAMNAEAERLWMEKYE